MYVTLWATEIPEMYWETTDVIRRAKTSSIFSEAILHHWLGSWDTGLSRLYPSIKGVKKAAEHLTRNPMWFDLSTLGSNTQSPLAQAIRDQECISLTATVSPEEIKRRRQEKYRDPEEGARIRERVRLHQQAIRADPVKSAALSEKKHQNYVDRIAKDPQGHKQKSHEKYMEQKEEFDARKKVYRESGKEAENKKKKREMAKEADPEGVRKTAHDAYITVADEKCKSAKWRYHNDPEYRAEKKAAVAANAASKKEEKAKKEAARARGEVVPDSKSMPKSDRD